MDKMNIFSDLSKKEIKILKIVWKVCKNLKKHKSNCCRFPRIHNGVTENSSLAILPKLGIVDKYERVEYCLIIKSLIQRGYLYGLLESKGGSLLGSEYTNLEEGNDSAYHFNLQGITEMGLSQILWYKNNSVRWLIAILISLVLKFFC